MALIEEAHKAARLLLDHAYVRILARDDPDAVCAAALLGHALRRENVDFHVSWLPRLGPEEAKALEEERNDATILLGLSQDGTPPAGGRQVVLETGREAFPAEARLDAAHASEARPELSLSALAQLVAVAMAKRNRDLSPVALVGASASWRHVASRGGLDAEILSEAVETGVVLDEPALALHGPLLATALSSLDAPYVAGVTGRARNVKKLLADLKLNGDAPPSGLTRPDAEKLGDFLTLRLLAQHAPDAALDALFRRRPRALQGPHTGMDLAELARLVEAACANDRCGLAFAALWPEPAAGAELLDNAAAVREELVAALLRAERELKAEGPLRVLDAPRAPLAMPLADRAALSFVPDGAVALARHVDETGATLALRAFALDADLGRAARGAAHACAGHAWGDPRRARAWVPAAEEDRFRKLLSEALPA